MVNEALLIERKGEKIGIVWKRRVKLMRVVMVAVKESKEKKDMHKTQERRRRSPQRKEKK